MNFLRNKKLQKNKIGKRNGGSGWGTVVGYGLLTLVLIWTAALVPNIVEGATPGFWILPSVLTLFVLIIGWVLLKPDKDGDY